MDTRTIWGVMSHSQQYRQGYLVHTVECPLEVENTMLNWKQSQKTVIGGLYHTSSMKTKREKPSSDTKVKASHVLFSQVTHKSHLGPRLFPAQTLVLLLTDPIHITPLSHTHLDSTVSGPGSLRSPAVVVGRVGRSFSAGNLWNTWSTCLLSPHSRKTHTPYGKALPYSGPP